MEHINLSTKVFPKISLTSSSTSTEPGLTRLSAQNLSAQNLSTQNLSTQKRGSKPVLQVSIVSNSHLLREALLQLLQTYPLIHEVHSYAGDVAEELPITDLANHLILVDSGIGQEVTIPQIRTWRSLQPSPYIVVLELKKDADLILDCVEAGAHGYVLQGASGPEVIQVIEQVYQGVAQCSPEVTAKLFDRLAQSNPNQPSREKSPLTRRETEVLHWIAKNYSDRDIATELVIEVRTVKHHVHNILRKLQVKHRWNAAQVALKNHWLERSS